MLTELRSLQEGNRFLGRGPHRRKIAGRKLCFGQRRSGYARYSLFQTPEQIDSRACRYDGVRRPPAGEMRVPQGPLRQTDNPRSLAERAADLLDLTRAPECASRIVGAVIGLRSLDVGLDGPVRCAVLVCDAAGAVQFVEPFGWSRPHA